MEGGEEQQTEKKKKKKKKGFKHKRINEVMESERALKRRTGLRERVKKKKREYKLV